MVIGSDGNPDFHYDAPPTSCEYVGEGGTLARLLKLGGRRRRTNRRAPPLNQSHLHTLPMARWSLVLMATLIYILMLPPPAVDTVVTQPLLGIIESLSFTRLSVAKPNTATLRDTNRTSHCTEVHTHRKSQRVTESLTELRHSPTGRHSETHYLKQ